VPIAGATGDLRSVPAVKVGTADAHIPVDRRGMTCYSTILSGILPGTIHGPDEERVA